MTRASNPCHRWFARRSDRAIVGVASSARAAHPQTDCPCSAITSWVTGTLFLFGIAVGVVAPLEPAGAVLRSPRIRRREFTATDSISPKLYESEGRSGHD